MAQAADAASCLGPSFTLECTGSKRELQAEKFRVGKKLGTWRSFHSSCLALFLLPTSFAAWIWHNRFIQLASHSVYFNPSMVLHQNNPVCCLGPLERIAPVQEGCCRHGKKSTNSIINPSLEPKVDSWEAPNGILQGLFTSRLGK